MLCLGLWLAWSPSIAHAGSGPWVLSKGDHQIYFGIETERWSRLAMGAGSYADDVVRFDNAFYGLGLKAIASVGVVKNLEIEFELPYALRFSTDPEAGPCQDLGAGACDQTSTLGVLQLRVKGLVLDEVYGAPLSMALGLDVRFGQFTAASRDRITGAGEGTFDLAPKLSLGRTGPLGKDGYWSIFLDAMWRYRFPLAQRHNGRDLAVPGWEIDAAFESLFTPVRAFSFGPSVALLSRPVGLDFGEFDTASVDRFASLRILQLSLGGKLIVRGHERVAASFGAFHSVYAQNNPSNVFYVTAGVSVRGLFRRRKDG